MANGRLLCERRLQKYGDNVWKRADSYTKFIVVRVTNVQEISNFINLFECYMYIHFSVLNLHAKVQKL